MAKDKPANQLISHGRVAENRRARHDYDIEDTLEAGIMLQGTEVKSLRTGRGNIAESYAGPKDGELYLFNAHIPDWKPGVKAFAHEPRRARKLLVHRRELARLIGAVTKDGMTLVPLSLYFNNRGIAKVQIGLAKGRKSHDKRQAIKERDWNREKARVLRDRNRSGE